MTKIRNSADTLRHFELHIATLLIAILMLGANGRVRAQSALDAFNPNANNRVRAIAVQPDGKIVIGGEFTELAPNGGALVIRNYIARLNSDGTVDGGFNPNADGPVRAIAVLSNGKIVIGGDFAFVGGQTNRNIARLNATTGAPEPFNTNGIANVNAIALQLNGAVLAAGGFILPGEFVARRLVRIDPATGAADVSYNPNPNNNIFAFVVQPTDGKILAGGSFTNIGGQTRNRIARLDGNIADSFNPNANNQVLSLAVQADGKVWAGGTFTNIGGQARNFLARLDGTTGAADSANPNPNNSVLAIALQPDGKIIVAGNFTMIGGQARNFLARLDSTNGLADSFNPNPNNSVESLALDGSGRVLMGGGFTAVGSPTRNRIARLDTLPRLNIRRTGTTNVVLSWLTNFTGFTLQANTNLNTNVWSAVSPSPAVSGSNDVVTNSLSGQMRFYRLRQ